MNSPRVVVITGASSGVGRAVARMLAERGDSLGLIARGEEGLKAAVKEAEAAGARAFAVPCDVADAAALERAADQIERTLGPIDVWINNAMTSVFAEFMDISPDEFKRVTEVTYLGYVYGTQSALRRMLPRDRGVVVQVGSAVAYRGLPLQSAYSGAKHAIGGFTDSIRAELMHRKSRVRITTVQLPALNTPQFDMVENRMPNRAQPVPPIYQPEVAARAIVWASDHPRRREVFVGGTTVGTVLGDRVMAGALDRYLGWTGYRSQQTSEPNEVHDPSNLWEPVSGDHGAHGAFDRRAHDRSAQWWISARRGRIAVAAAAAAALVWARRRRPS